MKTHFFSFMLPLLALFMTMSLGNNAKTDLNESDAWITPTGITIPYEHSGDWQGHIDAVGGAKFSTRFCTLPDGRPGIYCVKGKPDDCTREFQCTYCVNCPTPTPGGGN